MGYLDTACRLALTALTRSLKFPLLEPVLHRILDYVV